MMTLLTTIWTNLLLPIVLIFLALVLPLMLMLEFGIKNK